MNFGYKSYIFSFEIIFWNKILYSPSSGQWRPFKFSTFIMYIVHSILLQNLKIYTLIVVWVTKNSHSSIFFIFKLPKLTLLLANIRSYIEITITCLGDSLDQVIGFLPLTIQFDI